MTTLRVVMAALLAVLCMAAAPRGLHAQQSGQLVFELPTTDPFPAAPEIVVHAQNFQNTSGLRIRLRLALDIGFGLVVFDSTIADQDARFRMIKLLPESRDIFAEATAIDITGRAIASAITLAGHTGPRLQLVFPAGRTAVTVLSRTPRFSWRSAAVTAPPGPWVYELFITNVATQETRSQPGITDTMFTWRDTLQANTSYRWRVVARLANGLAVDSAVVASASSFVIAPTDAPVSTLLYQNFPNPFPAPSSATTCLWFDLAQGGTVHLTIHDLRGNLVRTMVPGQLPGDLTSGRYGRLSQFDGSGCDPRLAWDGTADDGRTVAPGIYLVRLVVNGRAESMKKILFQGR